ncbi:MAG: exo-alpha-sialidase [Planctomycetaceae bacterium]|nr:exo-alpha-sialidase [Planctomycetaceae bacterium]
MNQHRSVIRVTPASRILLAFLTITLWIPCSQAQPGHVLQHQIVYQHDGHFAGWPANNGIWNWGDEIVVGFTLGHYRKNPDGGHDIDRERPSTTRQARSRDGGVSWETEVPAFIDVNGRERATTQLTSAIDFSNPNLALRFRDDRFYASTDRCHTWSGPFQLPTFGRPELLARTDYIIESPQQVTAFVAASKDNGKEGQPLCIRTTNGGLTWNRVGWIGQQPPETYGYAIMPATVALGDRGYLSMIRRGGVFDGEKQWWLETWLSPDLGQSWYQLDQPRIENAGNPATLTRLKNGEIAMTYGWRLPPYGIRGKVSYDNGQSWSSEFVLTADGVSWDLGYPRTI